jgi:hypothetical protein
MEKRYQVFVSSTYTDLIEERNEVMQAILELDCMPAGMELFPAANDTQWNWIKKVIKESDYYIVIIGGRYGTISEITKQSYTEMEYRYAVEIGKPVIAFLHDDPLKIPSGMCEKDPQSIKKLEEFRKFVQKRLCKYWSNPTDLGAKVSRSLTQLIKQYPAIGWVRADTMVGESAETVLKLRKKIEDLEEALEKARTEKPSGTEMFASGDDLFSVKFTYKRRLSRENEESGRRSWFNIGEYSSTIELSWDEIFSYISPRMINRITEEHLEETLSHMIEEKVYSKLENQYPNERFIDFSIDYECFQTIIIQLRALKLITISKDDNWELTPYGDYYMSKLLAVHKK